MGASTSARTLTIPTNTRSQKCRLRRCWLWQKQTKDRVVGDGTYLMNFSKLSSPSSVLGFCLFSAAVTVGPMPVSSAQSPDQVVKWTVAAVPPRVNAGGRLTVTLSGTIQDG